MKTKKRIQAKNARSGTKWWAILLAMFSVVGVAAAVVVPLVMCKKNNVNVYVTTPSSRLLDNTHTSSTLTTELNNKLVDNVTYSPTSPFTKYIDVDQTTHAVCWAGSLRPTTTITARIETMVDGNPVASTDIVLESPAQNYTIDISESILRMIGDTATIKTQLNGNYVTTGIVYSNNNTQFAEIVTANGVGTLTFKQYPAAETTVTITSMLNNMPVATNTITLLKQGIQNYTVEVNKNVFKAVADSAAITTKLNGNIVPSGITYISSDASIATISGTNVTCVKLPDTDTEITITARLNSQAIATTTITVLKGQKNYTVVSDKNVLHTVTDTTNITTKLDNSDFVDGVTYSIDQTSYASITFSSGRGKVTFTAYPSADTTVIITAILEGYPIATTEITLLKRSLPGITINSSTEKSSHTIYSDDGATGMITIPQSIDVKDLSPTESNMTFYVDGAITCPIIIPSDYPCWLIGNVGSSINTYDGYGIIVGNDTQNHSIISTSADIGISCNNINSLPPPPLQIVQFRA